MNFYEDKQARKLERFKELAEKRANEAKAEYKHGNKLADMIPIGQPILVGHHSEGMHRRHIEKIHRSMDKAIELKDKSEYYEGKVDNILNPHGISSDDPEAVTKLKEEIAQLEIEREQTKKIPIIERDYSFSDVDMRSVNLSSISTKIRAKQKRILELQARDKIEEIDKTLNGVTLSIDKTENRIKLSFPGKPNEGTRTKLKSNGFHWSPFNMVWQRMISNQAIYLAEEIQKEFKA